MFRFGAEQIIGDYVEADEPADLNVMHRDLALHLAENVRHNKKRMTWMWRGFEAACVLLVIEIVAWIVALAQL